MAHVPFIPVKIVVVGSGYVGLVAAVCFAEMGHSVICVEKDRQKLDAHRQGMPTIHERLLPELLSQHLDRSLFFAEDLAESMHGAEAVFIAVGTPQSGEGQADLSYVESVAREIALSMREYMVIVEKSTVPVYTNDWIRRLLERQGIPGLQFDVVSNPEFLREGTAIADFLHPDRILVGTESTRAAAVLKRIYAPLTNGSYYRRSNAVPGGCTAEEPPPLLLTSAKSAEIIKHASNAFLAMKVAFINQVANVCEAANADVAEVAHGIGLDHRIGPHFFHAGIGYGGSCFSKDIAAFRSVAAALGVDFDLLLTVERANQEQRLRFFGMVGDTLGVPPPSVDSASSIAAWQNKRLGVLGLAFKGGTDDVRDSPALALVQMFLDAGATVAAFDPAAMPRALQALPSSEQLSYAADEYAAAAGADALVILTDWPQFATLDWARIRESLAQPLVGQPLVIDGRNLCSPAELARHGLTYRCIGRSSHSASATSSGPVLHSAPSSTRSFFRSVQPARRVLLAGAAGFLGSHLVDRLLAEQYQVLGVDNLSTGDLRNLAHLHNEPRFEFVQQDICAHFDPGPVDLILNFASPASPVQYARLGLETLRAGSEGTRRLLELARRYQSKFLHASTSECYGSPLVHPQPESYWGNVNPIGPRSVYDESKRFAEALVMAYHRYYGVDTGLARIFNTYGPRMQPNDGRVISNFIMQALAGENLTIYGDGLQTRSFCYVSDLIEGLMRLMCSEEAWPVNIGNPGEYTILDCARQVIAICESSSQLVFELLPQDDPMQRRPDITRAKALLDWVPTVSLADGLQQTIPYFRTRTTAVSF